MTSQPLRGVGYCARMTRAGDWAFDFALDLAVRNEVRLDIFFFPTPPSKPHASRGRRGELSSMSEKRRAEMEKELRFYYDEALGEFVNVGFRLCEGDEDPELRRCLLIRKEYDLLVLGYEGYHGLFGQKRIEEFAESLPCPVVLVGPERPDQYFVNSPGKLWVSRIGLHGADCHGIEEIEIRPTADC